jgi:hypothetical protein
MGELGDTASSLEGSYFRQQVTVMIKRGSQLLHNRWTMMSMTEFVAKAAASPNSFH